MLSHSCCIQLLVILCSFSRNYCCCCFFTDTRPTFLTLEDFQLQDGSKINILDKIGAQYDRLVRLLLKDGDGTILEQLERDNRGKADTIKSTTMTKWLRGEGEMPVTWRTLIGALEKVNLTLAQDMRAALQ